jgi:hypothetical protein
VGPATHEEEKQVTVSKRGVLEPSKGRKPTEQRILMETFVVVLQNETLKVKADGFVEMSGKLQFYRGEDETLVAWFLVEDVQRVYEEQ